MLRIIVILTLTLLVQSVYLGSLAETASSFQLAAEIVPGCQINNQIVQDNDNIGLLGSINFGSTASLSTETRTASFISNAITFSCTPDIAISIRVDGGQNYSSSRRLKVLDENQYIDYALFEDAGFQNSIPVNQAITLDTSNDPGDIDISLYAKLFLSGNASPGIYQDNLVITMEW